MNSQLLEVIRQGEEHREILDGLIEDVKLFDLQDDDFEYLKKNNITDTPENKDDCTQLLPPGIKLFSDKINCLYDEESIEPECFDDLFKNGKDSSSLRLIECILRYERLQKTQERIQIFTYFYKLLFTKQSEDDLDIIPSILINLLNQKGSAHDELSLVIKEFPVGLVNLGASEEDLDMEKPIITTTEKKPDPHEAKEVNILHNIKAAMDILTFTVAKALNSSDDKGTVNSPEIDRFFINLLILSQDPLVLRSSILPSIQNLIAHVLDLYPQEEFPVKVQDLVERLGEFWENSTERFHHHTAYYLTCNVLPLSTRGKMLRASTAFYAIMCCLEDEEVEVWDYVTISKVYKYCRGNIEAIIGLDMYVLHSILRLIDATIERPYDKSNDKGELKNMKELLNRITLSNSSDDMYNAVTFRNLRNEIYKEWDQLVNTRQPKLRQTTLTSIFSTQYATDDF